MDSNAIKQLKRHEGFRAKLYHCTEGRLTIGYGYNLDANPANLPGVEITAYKNLGMSERRAAQLLSAVVAGITRDLYQKLPWIVRLNEARQAVLVNMAYNLGIDGLLKFKRTLGLIEHGDYDNAADAMLQSKWAGQVKGRAVELAEQMRKGKFSDAATG